MRAVPVATASQRLAEFASQLCYDDIPPEVVQAAKLHVLDTLGCGLAAAALGIAIEGRQVMAELGGGPEATVIGRDRLPAASAAFANAMLCHGLDFDDTHSDSVAHVSVVVAPTSIAVAESCGADGRSFLAAVISGNEVVARIGMAASGEFHTRGFHPTAVCGIFGGVAAAARLSGLDRAQTASALGIAGSMASGIFAYLEDGTATKPIHPAWAAHGAIVASRLAVYGAQGPPHVLEGRFGVYHSFVGRREVDLEAQLADLGERWETPRIAYKPYPACHYMHGSLGATSTLCSQVSLDEIEEIVVSIPPGPGVDLVLEPVAAKLAPRTDYDAKFSLQYSTAAMLVHGEVGVRTYTADAIADPRVLELARKVRYETKEYATDGNSFPGGVRIKTKDGRLLDAEFPYQKGSPENPLSAEEVKEKFQGNARLALSDADVEALEETVLGIEEHDDLRGAFAALARAGAREGVSA